jgi:ABC-type transport system involved in cytochrome c biogenesis permease subunit
MLKTILKPFASLTLTVILLAFSMVLIYAGTLAQVDRDIWRVQHEYFHTLFCWLQLQDLVPRFSSRPAYIHGSVPFPGGYFIGCLLLINLLAAHSMRFKVSLKDLWLIPQAAIIGVALYVWQIHYDWASMSVALVVGVLFLVTLFLVHNKRAGVIIIHLGLILLLAGEGITSGAAKETRMTIDEGSFANYASDIREAELAIVDRSAADHDHHVVIGQSVLKTGAAIDDSRLPFQVKIDSFYGNSHAVTAESEPSMPFIKDKKENWTVKEAKGVAVADGGAIDMPSAFVTLSKNGRELGKYVLTVMNAEPTKIDVDGKTFDVSLRFQREYKPYTIALKKFSFDRYTGTSVAKNFSADVTLIDPSQNERRDVRIWMNHPLRYRGETIYQSGYDEKTEKTTILQVVHNPAMTLPYTAVIIAGIGLIVHFGVSLVNFLSRRDLSGSELALVLVGLVAALVVGSIAVVVAGWVGVLIVIVGFGLSIAVIFLVRGGGRKPNEGLNQPPPLAKAMRGRRDAGDGKYELAPQSGFFSARFLVPAGLLALCLFYAIGHAAPRALSADYDMDTFAKIPLSHEGRVQPMDSFARNALKVMRGRESALLIEKDKDNQDVEKTIQPIPWLLDVMADNPIAVKYKIFVIDHPDVKSYLGLDERKKYFSIEDLLPCQEKLTDAFKELGTMRHDNAKSMSPYQVALLEVCDRASMLSTIRTFASHHVIPPTAGNTEWSTIASAARAADQAGKHDPLVEAYVGTLQAYRDGQPAEFNSSVQTYHRLIESKVPLDTARSAFETWYNHFDPIVMSIVFYVMVFVLAALSWMGFSKPLARGAFWVLLLTMVIHTFALAARIYMSGRPPVTNLASSAIFIGWGMVVFAICLELIFRNGIGSVLAAVAGFPTLFIAQRLSLDGDTMKVLQAVLDTNVWLGTHVVCITLGYAATFLSGLIGITYIVIGVFTPHLDSDLKKTLGRMMYGITCFGLLFSFVGTILGGLWADQSWGRFWGWDPKENGAILIVLANAIFLHARWGGLVKERGMASIAIFGNIITAWSYFGTNMLGVGLHSYGFMASAVMWLNLFIVSQVLFIILCTCLPIHLWQSFAEESPPGGAKARV